MKKIISVNVSKKYDVIIEADSILHVFDYISNFAYSRKVAIITDDIVDRLYSMQVYDSLKKQNIDVYKFVFANGEESKNIRTLSLILEFLAENKFKRNDLIVAIGGGVVGDISGLSASLYMRGIEFIQIPTTLLAMVDASIGGKTAVDIKAGKNLVGAFWQPSLVLCDTNIIKNLPNNIFVEGMAEVIKADEIGNFGIIDLIKKSLIYDNIDYIVEKCIELKRDIVQQDEFETLGVRKLLNVGHTYAHALEKLSDYKISHGEAVGCGLFVEALIANRLGLCDEDTKISIQNAVLKVGLLNEYNYPIKDIVNTMKVDKKNTDDLISFMLPKTLGNCVERKLSTNEVEQLLGLSGGNI